MGKLVYFIKEALRGFYQAKLMTFVSVVTIAVALFFLTIFAIAYYNVHIWLNNASKQAVLVAYLTDDYSDSSSVQALIDEISEYPASSDIKFINKTQAWNKFEELYGPEMLDAVEENPFPASIEIQISAKYQSTKLLDDFKNEIENINGIDGTQYSKEWFNNLKQITSWFFLTGIIIIPFFLLALLFIISNTIKLTIYARRDLISNMRFVGATDFYIKMPFIFEGMLQGFIGGALSFIAVTAVKLMMIKFTIVWGPWYMPLIFGTALGVLFGWIGSISAIRKFLV